MRAGKERAGRCEAGAVYQLTGAAYAKRSHFALRGGSACEGCGCGCFGTWCSMRIGTLALGAAIFAERSSAPGGVGGEIDDAVEVDAECVASGVSHVEGEDEGVM